MKNMIKPISAVTMAALMSFSVLPVYAEDSDTDSITKDETVYTVLNADGSVKEITVSDTLHSDNGFNNYEDTSSLSDVENLKSDDAVNKSSNGYVWNTDETDIYYQGKSTSDLPLNVSITYTLDGKQYDPQELLGKSGHIKIKVEIENTSKQTYTVDDKSYELVTPFITAVGGMLDEDIFTNVEINHGTVTSDSSHAIVAGVMIPGLRDGLNEIVDGEVMSKLDDYLVDDIMIEADVKDFESPTLMIAAATSTDALEDQFEDTDLTTIFDQLDQLKEATNQLITGTSELYDGAVALNEGIGTLQSGTSQLASGASTLYDGSTELATGANSLYAGLSTLSGKSSELNSGVQTVADQILKTVNTQLTASGLGEVTWDNYATMFQSESYLNVSDDMIAQAKATIKSQVEATGLSLTDEQLNGLIYLAAINQDSSTFTEKLTSAGTKLATASTILQSTAYSTANTEAAHILAGNYDENISKVLNTIKQYYASKDSSYANYENAQIYSLVASQIGKDDKTNALIFAYACELNNGTYTADSFFTEAVSNLTTLTEVNTAINTANNDTVGQQTVKGALIEVVKSQETSQLQTALSTLNGVNALVQGVKTYTAGVDTATAGAKSLADGATKVASGSKDLKDGIDTVNSGVGTLKSGSEQLADGAKTLKDGMEEYNDEAISKLTENSKISDLEGLADLFDVIKDEGTTYNNYSGISEGSEGSVKFVYKVNAVKEEKVETTSEEETEEKTSFWDRIVGLFDFSNGDSAE